MLVLFLAALLLLICIIGLVATESPEFRRQVCERRRENVRRMLEDRRVRTEMAASLCRRR